MKDLREMEYGWHVDIDPSKGDPKQPMEQTLRTAWHMLQRQQPDMTGWQLILALVKDKDTK